jgi:serine protease
MVPRSCTLLACAILAAGLVLASDDDAASTLAGRAPDRLIVKFDDAARVRLRGNRLVSDGGVDLRTLDRTLLAHGFRSLDPLFRADELTIDEQRRNAEHRSGRFLPDLNSYFEVRVDPIDSEKLLGALKQLGSVQTAYRAALPQPAPVDILPPTPDAEAFQIYLDPAPAGIDARDAWTRPGGRGEGILIVDIEYNWRDTHEDLESALSRQECFTPFSTEIEHGTAVIGELIGGDNAYGITGIANQADVGLVTHWPASMTYSVARAVQCATGLLGPGDVMLIEAQTVGPNSTFVPPEWDQAEYDAITNATAAGIIVVETAGNGNENLDDSAFGGAFDRAVRDSGALIVGAGANLYYPPDQPDLSRLDFSTYGSRVDLHGWGDDVLTTGYGDAFDGGGDPNQFYTDLFNGTSSAAPMIAGAAAILQGVQIACGGDPLPPAIVREILVQTGSPQVAGPFPGNIGPRPDLRAALERVDVDNDTDGWAECQGDCDDAVAATHPGAAEVNDGLDNQCPDAEGYGSIDEISGESGFHDPTDKTKFSWMPQAGALSFEVARSTSPDFSTGCASWQTGATFIQDGQPLGVGAVFHYLVRPLTPFAGSWGRSWSGGERSGPCL